MKVGGRRNFGYGKTLTWAGNSALRARYGNGHFATRAAHAARWKQFADFTKGKGIKDARDITKDMIDDYATLLRTHIAKGEMATSYAQNQLSTINVVLGALRGDSTLRISPAGHVGKRNHIRRSAPEGLDDEQLRRRLHRLRDNDEPRVAVVADLARHLGLRFREASLLDAKKALREASRTNRINITQGTKGGRGKGKDRWVPVAADAEKALHCAAQLQGDRTNLIPAQRSFRHWRDHAYYVWQRAKGPNGTKSFHELRAAYACDRYHALTGQAAPCVAGIRLADKALDEQARVVLAQELGHDRIDVVAAYIGSAK